MFPREHGAYGQLLFPIATALAIGRPGAGALALAAAAVCAFLAHEPLLVLLGQRGARAARAEGARARRWFGAFAAAALAFAIAAIVLLPAAARVALGAPAAIGILVAAVIFSRREHTMGGEIVTAAALAALASPLALGAGATAVAARTVALVFVASFVSATACVHGVIVQTRHPPAASARTVGATVATVSVIALAMLARLGVVRGIASWAALPMCAGGVVLVAVPPSARALRTVGWTLVATTLLTSLVLVVGLRYY
ncbi:MAG TPA: YwiC-like family protein [Vicinamibacterales bacterium]|nr:YwiC-like family protein [Vicinamibacterales bacterium]